MADLVRGIAPRVDTYANWVSANPTLGKDLSGKEYHQIIFATGSPVGDIMVYGNEQSFTTAYAAGQFMPANHSYCSVDYDTTSADEDISTTLSALPVGVTIQITNTGTGGNHVITGIDDIELGVYYDGTNYKQLSITFTKNSSGWRYDDCLIDDYNSSSQRVRKTSTGFMTISGSLQCTLALDIAAGSLYRNAINDGNTLVTWAEQFIAAPVVQANLFGSIHQLISAKGYNTTSTLTYFSVLRTASASSETIVIVYSAIGSWRAAA